MAYHLNIILSVEEVKALSRITCGDKFRIMLSHTFVILMRRKSWDINLVFSFYAFRFIYSTWPLGKFSFRFSMHMHKWSLNHLQVEAFCSILIPLFIVLRSLAKLLDSAFSFEEKKSFPIRMSCLSDADQKNLRKGI